jgi:hypothetical protein
MIKSLYNKQSFNPLFTKKMRSLPLYKTCKSFQLILICYYRDKNLEKDNEISLRIKKNNYSTIERGNINNSFDQSMRVTNSSFKQQKFAMNDLLS